MNKEGTSMMALAKKDDAFEEAQPDDIVVLVMGWTGVGKSTFVKHLARGAGIDQTVEIGEDLESCTTNLQPIPIPAHCIPNNITITAPRLVIVDTPGLNDTYVADSEIWRRIDGWLASSYSDGTKPDGVICLHDMSLSPILDDAVKTFTSICKKYTAKSVILSTRNWAAMSADVAKQHDKQLYEKFGGKMIHYGTQTQQFDNSESAWKIVGQILSNLKLPKEVPHIPNLNGPPKRQRTQSVARVHKVSPRKKVKWLKKEAAMVKRKNEVWGDARPDDVVVIVMGSTSVGKSTFVNHLARGAGIDQTMKIGEDLESCTVNLEPITIPAHSIPNNITIRGQRLVIVDTPGFDDTYTDDSETLRRIAVWLASSYSRDMKLGGVIYLYDITQPRMLGTSLKNFKMFQSLCGTSAAKTVILGTTKWGLVPTDVAEKREKQLQEKMWNNFMTLGARTERFEDSSDSAWKIMQDLLDSDVEAQILRIQEELVELEKIIPTTDAGKTLRYTLKEVLEMQKSSASSPGDREGGQKMAEKLQLIERLVAQIDELKVPMWHRFKSLFLTA